MNDFLPWANVSPTSTPTKRAIGFVVIVVAIVIGLQVTGLGRKIAAKVG